MGLYDRGYYHDEDEFDRPYDAGGATIGNTMISKIIIVSVVLWIIDALTAQTPVLQPWLCVRADTLANPLQYYRLLTAGFVHHPVFPSHIVFSMLILYFLGSSLESRRGPGEFLRLYLVAIVLGNVAFCLNAMALGFPPAAIMFGSSAAVVATVVAVTVYDPHRTIMIFFVLPAPLWLVTTLYVVIDVSGKMRGQEGAIVPLMGAFCGYAYAANNLSLTRWLPTPAWFSRLGSATRGRRRSSANLKVYDSTEDSRSDSDAEVAAALEAEVDRILRKINRDGEASLTKTERATLEKASRKYRKR